VELEWTAPRRRRKNFCHSYPLFQLEEEEEEGGKVYHDELVPSLSACLPA
jgi:hypothetical protein